MNYHEGFGSLYVRSSVHLCYFGSVTDLAQGLGYMSDADLFASRIYDSFKVCISVSSPGRL